MKVILLMASTVDGKIAKDVNEFIDWTGKEDKKYFVKITKEAGVVIMGSTTYKTIGKPLPKRLNVVMTRNETLESDEYNLLYTMLPPIDILNELEIMGYNTVVLAGGPTINSLFLEAGLIDEIHITMVPKIFGNGLKMFSEGIDLDIDLVYNSSKELGDGCILMKYVVLNRNG